ncbi:hypothetical protein EPUS_06846 [Endocarpon pusillum Z07020]|uniref:Uncharacterized protein n=1 Tax=Endocarpon pusillum (strain Z07020 / HMAS-L-300199) TaxID=1263415 RepID=U1HQT5_ENDPU|nr:uncharacterized protein EPUS_06846 [Endocarpon pusillum Z07020]ERF71464.1 hypothetical protein EPUS_06846 [Endocarpon pusillum Z07020]
MPWPGLSNFLTSRPRPQLEDPYVTYVRKRCLENNERYRCGIPNLPLLEREEWAQDSKQAILDWQEKTVQRHNQDDETDYRNWNDLSRARRDSAMRDRSGRRTTWGRSRNGGDEFLSSFSGSQEPTNLVGETDEAYLARTMRSHGRSGMNHASGRSFPDRDFEDGGRATGEGDDTRDSFPQESSTGAAGQRGRNEHLDGEIHSSAATGNTSCKESCRDDEAEAFLNSSGDAGATGRGSSNEWSDEAEAFLNAHS